MNEHEYKEFIKCADDVEYFIETYVKRLDVNKGYIPVVLNDFQKEAIKDYKEKRFFSKSVARQKGKTFIASCLLLHTSIFKEYQISAVVTSKLAMGVHMLESITGIYDQLPEFLKAVKMTTRNKTAIGFDTNSEIRSIGSNSCAMRGMTIHNIYFDESDYISNLHEIVRAFYPCMAAVKTSRFFAFTTSKTDELFKLMEVTSA